MNKSSNRLFYSSRERFLWLTIVLVVASVYASIALVRSVDGRLTGDLGRTLWYAGFAMTALAMLLVAIQQGLLREQVLAWTGLAIGVVAVYVLLFTRVTSLEERTHLLEYSVITLLVHQALTERARAGGLTNWLAARAFCIVLVLGCADEGLQLVMPARVFDPGDMLFNALAAVLALTAILAFQVLGRKVRDRA